MEKKEKTNNTSFLVTSIGALIALIPGLSQLLKIKMLPDYWHNADLITGVVISVLNFIVVLILYAYRKDIAAFERKLAIKYTVFFFSFFLISVIWFNLLSIYCLIEDKDSKIAFVPILLSESINKKIADPQIRNRFNWVKTDYAENIKDEINVSDNGILYLQITMILFILSYLLIFILLICSILILGFHIAPDINLVNKPNIINKENLFSNQSE